MKHIEHLKNNGGYFQKFNWMPDEYGRKDDEERREMIDAKIKETNTHNFPFNAN